MNRPQVWNRVVPRVEHLLDGALAAIGGVCNHRSTVLAAVEDSFFSADSVGDEEQAEEAAVQLARRVLYLHMRSQHWVNIPQTVTLEHPLGDRAFTEGFEDELVDRLAVQEELARMTDEDPELLREVARRLDDDPRRLEDIARILKVSIPTVHNRLKKIVFRLRDNLDEES